MLQQICFCLIYNDIQPARLLEIASPKEAKFVAACSSTFAAKHGQPLPATEKDVRNRKQHDNTSALHSIGALPSRGVCSQGAQTALSQGSTALSLPSYIPFIAAPPSCPQHLRKCPEHNVPRDHRALGTLWTNVLSVHQQKDRVILAPASRKCFWFAVCFRTLVAGREVRGVWGLPDLAQLK
eukprot:128332-Amphidinium_carterae.1